MTLKLREQKCGRRGNLNWGRIRATQWNFNLVIEIQIISHVHSQVNTQAHTNNQKKVYHAHALPLTLGVCRNIGGNDAIKIIKFSTHQKINHRLMPSINEKFSFFWSSLSQHMISYELAAHDTLWKYDTTNIAINYLYIRKKKKNYWKSPFWRVDFIIKTEAARLFSHNFFTAFSL